MSRQNRLVGRAGRRPPGGVAANLSFSDDFTALSLRNAVPSGANKVRNSSFFTPAASTNDPAPWPENWTTFLGGGMAASIVGRGTATLGGQTVPTVDVRFQQSAGATGGSQVLYFERSSGSFAVAAGETWTVSAYVALVAGSASGATALAAQSEFRDLAGAWQWWAGATVSAPGATLTRYAGTGTIPGGNTARLGNAIFSFTSPAGAFDATFRFAGVQVEKAGSAGALVQTTADSGNWNSRFRWNQAAVLNHASPDGAERQYYTDIAGREVLLPYEGNPFDAATEAGVLRIAGTAQAGIPNGEDRTGASQPRTHLSGAITTYNGFKRQYGYFEMRARFPAGSGMWPAFWLLPYGVAADGNPLTAAELDVIEWYGSGPTLLTGTVHTGSNASPTKTSRTRTVGATDATGGFHTYGLEWTADTLRWFYDRVQYGADVATPADCKQEMYLAVNLALGSWAGPIDAAALPGILRVDYVKVWDAKPF